jgi:hypothetical protein
MPNYDVRDEPHVYLDVRLVCQREADLKDQLHAEL